MPEGSRGRRSGSRTHRRRHTSQGTAEPGLPKQSRASPLDRIHTAEGITLQHPEMGPVQLTNNFITESGELRLLVMVPEDSDGWIGVKVSDTTHRVERMPADGPAAAGGLLRVGDRVISVDGTLLGQTKLVDALNASLRQHALIVQRAATDLRAVTQAHPTSNARLRSPPLQPTCSIHLPSPLPQPVSARPHPLVTQVNGLKQLPEAALAGCHLAQLVRADLGSGRLAGKRTQIGLSVNKNNGIDYVVPTQTVLACIVHCTLHCALHTALCTALSTVFCAALCTALCTAPSPCKVPGSVAAFEGTLRTCDVVLELNGARLSRHQLGSRTYPNVTRRHHRSCALPLLPPLPAPCPLCLGS